MSIKKQVEIGGQTLTIETGTLAKQADGAVTVRYGDTIILVTAVAANTPRVGANFLPLTVDYREAAYSACWCCGSSGSRMSGASPRRSSACT